ncbi:MAG: SDR family NAD(P)-dependent oxidoreductase [Deltaproteobacteria bacterium]|nr:SDR family NAD(P)-dependent oxidoreductase [Deltaproteobacteria bacterium]
MAEMAEVLTEELGRPVEYVDIPGEAWGQILGDVAGMPPFLVTHLKAVAEDHKNGIFSAEKPRTVWRCPAGESSMTSPTHRRPTALVTGGSKGIGLALAREFARNGYDLLLVARKKEALKKAATEIEDASGVAVRTYAIDLAGPDAPEELFHYVHEAGIHVDALINNAGLGAHGAFAQSDRSRTNAMLGLNVVSLTSLTHLFLKPMLARGEGRIINVASVVAYFAGGPQWAAYVASKAYVLSFSRGLAAELRGTGVTVTALAPGSTATDFVADAGVGSTRVYRWLPKVSVERIARTAYRSAMKGRTTVVPGDPVLDIVDRRVAVTRPYQGHRRMTLTFPAFEQVGSIIWIVAGAGKTSMVERLLAADPTIPAGRVPQHRAVLITN